MPARVVDLRSDTVTLPTDEMRDAMRSAEVGDDILGEDPTVRRLQELAARMVGKEAALFVPSGTMANEVAIFVHTGRQGEILVEKDSHIVLYESGGPAVLSGVQIRTLDGARGVFTPRQFAEAIRDRSDPHNPYTTMVGIENTHNMAGGCVWTAAQTAAVASVAHENGIPLHMDGARLFNSAITQGVSAPSLTKPVDTVMFCLSKGLSAPVGSLVCGSQDFIEKALRVRKLFGGAMRQTGILAAAGIVALETMVDRLREDHDNARRLVGGLAKLLGVRVDLDAVQTNIVFADVSGTGRTAPELETALAAVGLKSSAYGPARLRFVTHRHVSREDVMWAIRQIERLLAPKAPRRVSARAR